MKRERERERGREGGREGGKKGGRERGGEGGKGGRGEGGRRGSHILLVFFFRKSALQSAISVSVFERAEALGGSPRNHRYQS